MLPDDLAQLPRFRRPIRRTGELLALLRHPGAVAVHRQQLLRRGDQYRHRHLARVRLRLCADTHLHEVQGLFQDHGDGSAAQSVSAQGHRTRVLVRQSGRAEQPAVRSFHLRADRNHHGLGVLDLSPRSADHLDRARDFGHAPVRGGRGPEDRTAPDLLLRHPARCALRAHQRHHRRVHPGVHRLRRAQGDRRQLQRPRHRHLQGGHRPAEFRDGGGGVGGAPDPGRGRIPHRPRGDAQADRPAFRPRGSLRTEAEPLGRPRDAALLPDHHLPDPRGSGHGPVRGAREVLALQPRTDARELLVRTRRRRPEGLLQFARHGGKRRGLRHRSRLRRRVPGREAAARPDRSTAHPFHRAASDGHPRHRAGDGVPVLHQRAGQPPRGSCTGRSRSSPSIPSPTSTPWRISPP